MDNFLETRCKFLELNISRNLNSVIAQMFDNFKHFLECTTAINEKQKNVILSESAKFKFSKNYIKSLSELEQNRLILIPFLAIVNSQFNQSLFGNYTEEDVLISNERGVQTTILFTALDLILIAQLRFITRIMDSKDNRTKIIEFTLAESKMIDKYLESLETIGDLVNITKDYLLSLKPEELTDVVLTLDSFMVRGSNLSKFKKNYTHFSTYIGDTHSIKDIGKRTCNTRNGYLPTSPFTSLMYAQIFAELFSMNATLLGNNFSKFATSVVFTISKALTNYEQQLLEAFDGMMKNDYSMARPDRNYRYQGLLVPGLVSTNVKMLFAVDYSGSISDLELSAQLGAIQEILDRYPNYNGEIVTFSVGIHTKADISNGESLLNILPKLWVLS